MGPQPLYSWSDAKWRTSVTAETTPTAATASTSAKASVPLRMTIDSARAGVCGPDASGGIDTGISCRSTDSSKSTARGGQ